MAITYDPDPIPSATRSYYDRMEASDAKWRQAFKDHFADVRYGMERADVNYPLTGRGSFGPETWKLAELLQDEADMVDMLPEAWLLLMLAAQGELRPAVARSFLDMLARNWAERQADRSI